MNIGSNEHYAMMESFERYIKKSPVPCRLDKEARTEWSKGHIYQDGHTNDLFHLYSAGYANARCVYMPGL